MADALLDRSFPAMPESAPHPKARLNLVNVAGDKSQTIFQPIETTAENYPPLITFDPSPQIAKKAMEYKADNAKSAPVSQATFQTVEKIAQTGLGVYWNRVGTGDEINRPFQWRQPGFDEEALVKPETMANFQAGRLDAYGFLSNRASELTFKARFNPTDPLHRTDAENKLWDNVAAVKQAQGETLYSGKIPDMKVDLSRIDDETKATEGWARVNNFAKAQDTLIAERATNLTALQKTEQTLYESEINSAKLNRASGLVALVGAEAANVGIDRLTPRQQSVISGMADFVAPYATFAKMAPFGKYAPLVKAGIIVGTHVAGHFLLDKPIDNQQK